MIYGASSLRYLLFVAICRVSCLHSLPSPSTFSLCLQRSSASQYPQPECFPVTASCHRQTSQPPIFQPLNTLWHLCVKLPSLAALTRPLTSLSSLSLSLLSSLGATVLLHSSTTVATSPGTTWHHALAVSTLTPKPPLPPPDLAAKVLSRFCMPETYCAHCAPVAFCTASG